jgi:O-antigen/teichoic acid export membrane protein
MTATSPRRSGRVRDIVRNITTSVMVQAIGVFTGAFVARLLGPAGRGILAGITNVSSSAAAIGDVGGPIAYVYQAARKPAPIRRLIRNAYTLAIAQTLTVGVVGSGAMLFVMRNEGRWAYVGIVFLFCYLPFNLLTRYLQGIVRGRSDFRRFNAVRYGLTVTYAIGVVALFAFSVHALVPILVVILISNVVALLVAASSFSRVQLRARGRRVDRPLVRETLGYGIRAHLGNLSPIDSLQVDIAIVLAFVGPREAGLYTVAWSAAGVVRTIGVAMGLVSLPALARSESGAEAKLLTGMFFRATVAMSLGVAVLVWSTSGFLVPLIYGSQFSGSVAIVQILVAGAAAASVRQVLNDCLRGVGKPLYGSIAEGSNWIAICIGLVILVPAWGVLGAATAVVASYLLALVVILRLAGRSGVSLRVLFMPTQADLDVVRRQLAKVRRHQL